MSSVNMSPDMAWIVGSVLTAAVATGPAYLASRSARKAESTKHAELEHEITRKAVVDAVAVAMGPISGRLDEMHAALVESASWQAEHTTSHAVAELSRIGHPSFEIRKGK